LSDSLVCQHSSDQDHYIFSSKANYKFVSNVLNALTKSMSEHSKDTDKRMNVRIRYSQDHAKAQNLKKQELKAVKAHNDEQNMHSSSLKPPSLAARKICQLTRRPGWQYVCRWPGQAGPG
jgi:hypothetical protein